MKTLSNVLKDLLVVFAIISYFLPSIFASSNYTTTGSEYSFSFWESKEIINMRILEMKDGAHNPYRDFNQFVNQMFFKYTSLEYLSDSLVPQFGIELGYYLQCYVRDLFLGTLVYWLTAGIWHLVIYRWMGETLFSKKGRAFPSSETILDQMLLAQASIFMYAGLPVLSEYFIESGITKAYYYVDEVGGLGTYFLYFICYLCLVELGIYWVHR